MKRIAVLGTGSWGIALAVMLHKEGNKMTLWSPFEQEVATLQETRQNKKLLDGVKIDPSITITTDIHAVADCEIVVFATPSFAVRQTAEIARTHIAPKAIVVSVSKGLEKGSLLRMSEVLKQELSTTPVVVLTGPSHAEEVARGVPTSVVSACAEEWAAAKIQEVFNNSSFRVYTSNDVVGAELGATVKNVIALCAGVCDGLNLGDNSKAALITRGITEMARLGVKMGAKNETFAGLAGIGDLVVTCTSMYSRNRRAGILIGQGKSPEQAVAEIGTVEGYHATANVWELAQKHSVSMPITEQCYAVLFEQKDPKSALFDLMARPKTHEMEHTWLSQTKKESLYGLYSEGQ